MKYRQLIPIQAAAFVIAVFQSVPALACRPSFNGYMVSSCSDCALDYSCAEVSGGYYCACDASGPLADPYFREVSSCGECRLDEQCGGSLFSGFTCYPRSPYDLTQETLQALAGDFIAHVDFGAGLLNDRLHLELSSSGALSGVYSVPGGFTSPVSHVDVAGLKARFSIVASENGTSTAVDYALERDAATGVFSGSVSERGQKIGSVRLERVVP